MLVVIIAYALGFFLLSTFGSRITLLLHFLHAVAWCLIHYFGLGLLLRAQSEKKFLVRHYLKHYYYPHDGGQSAIVDAFTNWKAIYNLSLCMCYGKSFFSSFSFQIRIIIEFPWIVSCAGVAWKAYLFPSDWAVGNALLRHTVGLVGHLYRSWVVVNIP